MKGKYYAVQSRCTHMGGKLEVLALIETGHSNQAIAARLVISLPTVKRHISNIYAKLGVDSRTQAVARAKELHLLSQ